MNSLLKTLFIFTMSTPCLQAMQGSDGFFADEMVCSDLPSHPAPNQSKTAFKKTNTPFQRLMNFNKKQEKNQKNNAIAPMETACPTPLMLPEPMTKSVQPTSNTNQSNNNNGQSCQPMQPNSLSSTVQQMLVDAAPKKERNQEELKSKADRIIQEKIERGKRIGLSNHELTLYTDPKKFYETERKNLIAIRNQLIGNIHELKSPHYKKEQFAAEKLKKTTRAQKLQEEKEIFEKHIKEIQDKLKHERNDQNLQKLIILKERIADIELELQDLLDQEDPTICAILAHRELPAHPNEPKELVRSLCQMVNSIDHRLQYATLLCSDKTCTKCRIAPLDCEEVAPTKLFQEFDLINNRVPVTYRPAFFRQLFFDIKSFDFINIIYRGQRWTLESCERVAEDTQRKIRKVN